MVKQYRTREIEATSVDTKTQLTTLGSETAPGPLLVPTKATKLDGILCAIGADGVAAGSASAIVRLEGGGLPEGPEIITVGAAGGESTTGLSFLSPAKFFPLDAKVTSGNEILVFGEMCGEDIGSIHFTVTLVFS